MSSTFRKHVRETVVIATGLSAILFGAFFSLIDARVAFGAVAAWKERTQELWDAAQNAEVRKTYRVWDVHPDLGLEFTWDPLDHESAAAGAVNGRGKLTWRKADATSERQGRPCANGGHLGGHVLAAGDLEGFDRCYRGVDGGG